MNYRKDIENCIEYIEEHIRESLTVNQITKEIGYSSYHFCRVFLFKRYALNGICKKEEVIPIHNRLIRR